MYCQGPPNHIQFPGSQFYSLTAANMVVENKYEWKITIYPIETLVSAYTLVVN